MTAAPPDWGVARRRMQIGGHLADVPEPHVRMFPGPERRQVRVTVSRIMRHYHVALEEERNPLWNSQLASWQTPWDDEGGEGKTFFDVLDTTGEVRRWGESIVREHFPEATHLMGTAAGFAMWDDPEYEAPDYIVAARNAARRAGRREGD